MINKYLNEYKKTVCVVGNGDSILEKGLGSEIDSHDIVVRINHTFTIGLQKDVGHKCTHWCINQSYACDVRFLQTFFMPRLNELKPHGLNTIIKRLDPVSRPKDNVDDTLRRSGHQLFREIVGDKYNVMELNFKAAVNDINPTFSYLPTSGFALICYLITRYKTVNIVGFGPRDNKGMPMKHYWPPNGKDLTNFFSDMKHSIETERKFINSLPLKRLDG